MDEGELMNNLTQIAIGLAAAYIVFEVIVTIQNIYHVIK